MAQAQNNVDRFAGRFMIQDRDHMSQIPQVQADGRQGARQVGQSQSDQGQQGGERRDGGFVYDNPRQVY